MESVSRISDRKRIREMNATELKSEARRLYTFIEDETMTIPQFDQFNEARAQYRQITGRALFLADLKDNHDC